MAYSGEMQLAHPRRRRDRGPARRAADQGPHRAGAAHRARPEGAWIPSVLAAADRRLTEVRRHVPDAGGLVIASDQDSARAYAADPAARSPASAPTVVLSDEKAVVEEDRRLRRRRPRAGWSPSGWCPRASTCPASRSASTPPPPRPRCSSPRPSAASCGPGAAARPRRSSCRRCRQPAGPTPPSSRSSATTCCGRTDQRRGRHLRRRERPARPGAGRRERLRRARRCPFEALGSEARFDRVLFDGGEFGHEGEVHVGSEEEMDFLGIPGLLEPDQMRQLLAQRRATGPRSRGRPDAGGRHRWPSSPPTSSSPCCAASSTAWSPPGTTAPARPHGVTHAALRKECGGPAAAVATADLLHERIDRLRELAARRPPDRPAGELRAVMR